MTHDEFDAIMAGLAEPETMEASLTSMREKVGAMIDDAAKSKETIDAQAAEIKSLKIKRWLQSSNPVKDVVEEEDPTEQFMAKMREDVMKLAQQF